MLSQLVLFLSLGCLSAVFGRRTNDADGEDDRAPLPRAKRKRRGRKEGQGLAPDEELAKLATFYLTYTKKLWPELAKAGLICERSDVTIQEMVDDFKARHRTGKVDPAALKPKSQRAAITLFSDTLFCKDCEEELTLLRSTDKYKSMYCQIGVAGKHDCTLASSKSTRIIEKSLLGFIREHLLTKKHVRLLVTKSNKFLKEEASKPSIDTRPLKARERRLTRDIERLLGRVARTTDEALCEAYDKEIAKFQRSLNEVRGELAAANRHNAPVPKPLDVSLIEAYLDDMFAVLNQEVSAAAEAIRALTGPIMVRQEEIPGRKRGAKWIAGFCPDFMRLLALVARGPLSYPDARTLEFLCAGKWITPVDVEVPIQKIAKYEEMAPGIKKMRDKGVTTEKIARKYRLSRQRVTPRSLSLQGRLQRLPGHADATANLPDRDFSVTLGERRGQLPPISRGQPKSQQVSLPLWLHIVLIRCAGM